MLWSYDGPRQYRVLLALLTALPATDAQVTLTFIEIEAMLGGPLPSNSWTRQFWSDSDTARANWQAAGFTASLTRFPGEPRVVFQRVTRPEG